MTRPPHLLALLLCLSAALVAASDTASSEAPSQNATPPRDESMGAAHPPAYLQHSTLPPGHDVEVRRAAQEPQQDPVRSRARSIARRVRTFHNFRAEIPLAVWSELPERSWSYRPRARCLRELARGHVDYELSEREGNTDVATLIKLTEAPIAGVRFISAHTDRAIEVDCELAARLPAVARLLKAQGVDRVFVNSSYREQPRMSFHTLGLALDISAFRSRSETWEVATQFEPTPGRATCEVGAETQAGKALLRIACALAESRLFSSVLTPNYNAGHRDHFHLDIRPNDPRFFLR